MSINFTIITTQWYYLWHSLQPIPELPPSSYWEVFRPAFSILKDSYARSFKISEFHKFRTPCKSIITYSDQILVFVSGMFRLQACNIPLLFTHRLTDGSASLTVVVTTRIQVAAKWNHTYYCHLGGDKHIHWKHPATQEAACQYHTPALNFVASNLASHP